MDTLSSLPNEIKNMIYKHVIRASVKGKEFKQELLHMWFKSRINRLLDETLNKSDLCKDDKIEHLLYDIDYLDMDMSIRSSFHQCLEYLYKIITAESAKTKWMFHIFGFCPEALNYLKENIGPNYVRGYVASNGYLMGYILLKRSRTDVYKALGPFSYIWEMDNMLLNSIDRHLNQFPVIELGNRELGLSLQEKCIDLCHKTVYSHILTEGCLQEMLPTGFHTDIKHFCNH